MNCKRSCSRFLFVWCYEYLAIPTFAVFVAMSSAYMSIYSFKMSLFILTGLFTFNPAIVNDSADPSRQLIMSLRIWWPEALIGIGFMGISSALYFLYKKFLVSQQQRQSSSAAADGTSSSTTTVDIEDF